MKILVSGSSGYIGEVVCRRLFEAGNDVTGLDNRLFAIGTLLPPNTGWLTYLADFRDVTSKFMSDFDTVVHLAAISNDPMGELDAALTDEINHVATVEFAKIAKASGVTRFVFSSSCSVYGDVGAVTADETTKPNPLTAYARSKLDAERGLRSLADNQFHVISLRNATVFGSSPSIRLDLVVNNLVGSAVTTGRIELNSDGTAWRPQIHVGDLADVFLKVLLQIDKLENGGVYNIGRDAFNYSVNDIASGISSVLGGVPVVRPVEASADARSYKVSFSKIAGALGIYPRTDVRTGALALAGDIRSWMGRNGTNDLRGLDANRMSALQRGISTGIISADGRTSIRSITSQFNSL